MKWSRPLAVVAIASCVYGAAPTRATESKPPAAASDPKWVESMQRLVKDLTEDNSNLRADNEALKRQLHAYEAKVKKLEENQGLVFVPPATAPAPQDPKQPPKSWQPFQFNGATYYLIPVTEHQKAASPRAGE